MHRPIAWFGSVVVLLTVILAALPISSTRAKDSNFSNQDLRGAYVAQGTGTAAFPPDHPFSVLNGPMATIGRFVADGCGNISGFAVQVNNGAVGRQLFTGTYSVEADGSFSVTMVGDTAFGTLAVEYSGVLFDEGKQAKVMQVGIPGVLPQGLAGITYTGTFIRQ